MVHLLLLLINLSFLGLTRPLPALNSCPVVETVPLYWSPKIDPAVSSRLEVRQCGGISGYLVLMLWGQKANKPSIILDTTDFGVVQTFIKDNVIVVVTNGGNRDQVFAFQFKRGVPTLVLRQVTKGETILCNRAGHVVVTITGIFAGFGPPETKTLEIETALSELEPRL